AAAAELLDWAEETARSGAELSDAQLSQALAPWLAEADDALPASFAEQLGAVAGSCRSLRDAPEEGARGLLSDAGCESAGYPWSEEAYALAERLTALAGPADGQIGN
ncbi:MAG: hypothetical protein IK095_02845, partial [Oscillospiraceae bacterium]|nr:hypothetical protein [Oscillospiraceae bacterium]